MRAPAAVPTQLPAPADASRGRSRASAPRRPGPETMIPPGECLYAGRKRRKPVQKQRPAVGAEKSNPSKRHRDRLNAELDHLASLLPLPPDIISKLDKLSVLRLSVSYLRVKSFFQALQERCPRQLVAAAPSPGDRGPRRGSAGSAVLEGRLLLESLHGFALVVSAEGMIFYASATIVDYLGFHQTDVMHQNIYDYIHVDDRQDFRRQLHWAMDPPQAGCGQPLLSETGEDAVLGRLLRAQEGGADPPTEYSAFLTRSFVCRVRCLLDSTSGFLTMQFQGRLKFLFGQNRRAPSGAALPPRLALFCVAAPLALPPGVEVRMKTVYLRAKHRADVPASTDAKAKAASRLCESELLGNPNYSAGRSNRENGLSLFRAPEDACRWGRLTARGPCLCLRGGPDLVLDLEGTAGAGEGEELGGLPRDVPPYSCRLEPLGPVKHLDWAAGRHSQDSGSAKRKLEPGKADPFPAAPARGACLPYPGAQGAVHSLRSAPSSHPSRPPPGACASRPSRALRDGHQGPAPPPTPGPFPQGGLDSRVPRPAVQHLPVGGYPAEDKLRGLLMPPGAPSHPTLSLDVPIKMESDSGSEDAVDGYCVSPAQVWLGASNPAKRQLATFPTKMHLKTEPGARQPLYSPPPGPGLLGAPPRPGRGLGPLHPVSCACLEPPPPPRLCVRSHQPPNLGCNCRAPVPAPAVKLEPLDSPLWAAHGQGLELTFFSGVYGTCIGAINKFGTEEKSLIGLSGIFIGIGEILGGSLFGLLSKNNRFGRNPVVLLGILVHFIAFYLIFLNMPGDAPIAPVEGTDSSAYIKPSKEIAIFCSFLLGLGDSCFNTQLLSILGFLYSEDSAPAFAVFKFVQSICAAVAFFYSNYLLLHWQLLVMVIFGFFGTVSFFTVEWEAAAIVARGSDYRSI